MLFASGNENDVLLISVLLALSFSLDSFNFCLVQLYLFFVNKLKTLNFKRLIKLLFLINIKENK